MAAMGLRVDRDRIDETRRLLHRLRVDLKFDASSIPLNTPRAELYAKAQACLNNSYLELWAIDTLLEADEAS